MQPAVRKIFISYRRADSTKDARALYERLRREFGDERVFMDLEGIAPGDDFVDSLQRHLEHCEVLVALIGPQWASARDAQGRPRLDDDRDLVRIELRTALARGIKVLPVLIDGAPPLQQASLPADLQPLVRRQAIALDYTRFESDVVKLVQAIRDATQADDGSGAVHGARRPPAPPAPRPLGWSLAAIAAALAVGIVILKPPMGSGGEDRQAPAPPQAQAEPAASPGPMASNVGGERLLPVAQHEGAKASPQAVKLLQALKRAGIQNSVGDGDLLAWLDDADRHYLRLAEASLRLVGSSGLAGDGVDIDKVNEVYSRAVGLQGDDVMPKDQAVDMRALEAALLDAYNNKNGTQWKEFARILRR
jgi:TIR domain